MISGFIKRPVDLSVQRIVKGEIGIHPRAVCANIVGSKCEGVFTVVKVTDLQVAVDLIEHFEAQGDILDLRAADSFDAGRLWACPQRLADDCKHRAAAEQFRPLNLEYDRQDIGSVECVGSDFLECDLSGRYGLFDHPHVKEERFRPLPGKDAYTPTLPAVLVVCVERHRLAAWGQAVSALRRTCRAVRSARNVEGEVE